MKIPYGWTPFNPVLQVVVDQTNDLLGEESANDAGNEDYIVPERVSTAVTWQTPSVGRTEANTNNPQILIPMPAFYI